MSFTGHVASWGERMPPVGATINWGHPLAQDLELLKVGGPYDPPLYDADRPSIVAGTPTAAPSSAGASMVLPSGATYAFGSTSALNAGINRMYRGRGYTLASIFALDGGEGHLCTADGGASLGGLTSNSTGRYWQFRVDNSTGIVRFVVFYSGGLAQPATTGAVNDSRRRIAFAVQDWSAGKAYIYVDGVQKTSANTSTNNSGLFSGNDTACAGVGQRVSGSLASAYTAMWSRALGASEIAALTADPYCIVVPR